MSIKLRTIAATKKANMQIFVLNQKISVSFGNLYVND